MNIIEIHCIKILKDSLHIIYKLTEIIVIRVEM